MNDKSLNYWPSMSDKALAEQIGAFVKHHRLQQNKSQEILAEQAGISRSTLSLLERGETVTVSTLLQVLRVLDQLQVMDAFAVDQTISPLELVRKEKARHRRARRNRKDEEKETDW